MKVYFIRHGESEENTTQILAGGESPLTETGKAQARFVAERFKTIPVDLILSSDMIRAKRTAEEIAKTTGQGIVYSPLLCEASAPSELLGLKHDDPKAVDVREKWLKKRQIDEAFHYSDEESLADLKARAKKALVFIEDREESDVAVVTHGTFLRMMIGVMALGDDFRGVFVNRLRLFLHTRNTGITVCEVKNGEWRLLTWNDYAHLG